MLQWLQLFNPKTFRQTQPMFLKLLGHSNPTNLSCLNPYHLELRCTIHSTMALTATTSTYRNLYISPLNLYKGMYKTLTTHSSHTSKALFTLPLILWTIPSSLNTKTKNKSHQKIKKGSTKASEKNEESYNPKRINTTTTKALSHKTTLLNGLWPFR